MPTAKFPAALIPLLKYMSDGRFHSGEALARRFGVSRATIFNLISEASSQGIKMYAVRGRGYRLVNSPSWLDAAALGEALRQQGLDYTLLSTEVVQSTNTWLMAEALAGAAHRTVVHADYQYAGRGRRGRVWQSPLGGSLAFSVLWRFERGVSQLSGLTIVVGLALARALGGLTGLPMKLKWPNDLLVGYRKLAGILVEVQGEIAGPSFAVIGIGVNERLPEQHRLEIDQAVVDLAELNVTAGRERILLAILKELTDLMKLFEHGGLAELKGEWAAWHVHESREVTVRLPDGTDHSGVASGVDDGGNLILSGATGEVRKFSAGEVSLRPVSNK
jgi:BirA family biotin operon repressor/biotin-[acetyl-CoA-carboxylase] ligase